MKPQEIILRAALLLGIAVAVCLLICGCATAKDNEINAVKFEKQSTANEVDQYITTAGRIALIFGGTVDLYKEK